MECPVMKNIKSKCLSEIFISIGEGISRNKITERNALYFYHRRGPAERRESIRNIPRGSSGKIIKIYDVPELMSQYFGSFVLDKRRTYVDSPIARFSAFISEVFVDDDLAFFHEIFEGGRRGECGENF
jgi:hypothetical protein